MNPGMDTAFVLVTLALLVVFGAALVVAAFLDRRRGREIEHDLSAQARHGDRRGD